MERVSAVVRRERFRSSPGERQHSARVGELAGLALEYGSLRACDAVMILPHLYPRLSTHGFSSASKEDGLLGQAETECHFPSPIFYLFFHHVKHCISSTVLVDDVSMVLLCADFDY